MDVVSHTSKGKDSVGALRNDSAWVGNGPLVKDNLIRNGGSLEEEDVTDRNAATSPPVPEEQLTTILADFWEESVSFGVHNDVATPSSLFNQTTTRKAGKSRVDDCISPKTRALSGHPLSTSNETDALADIREVAAGQRKASLQLLRPYGKGAAGGAIVGIVQNGSLAEDFDMRLKDAQTTVCVEEYHWHRDRPSRLLSYHGNPPSSEEDVDEDVDENVPGCPVATEADSESDDAWMMAEDTVIPAGFKSGEGPRGLMLRETGLERSGSNKSGKFVKKKRTSKRASNEGAWPSIHTVDESKVAAPRALRHYSYGASLDLPPIGIQSHRGRAESKVSENEAVLDAELGTPPDHGQLEAQSEPRDEPLSMFRKWMVGILLGIANVVLLGSSLACILGAPMWNESQLAVAAIPLTVWLCLVLQVLQLRRGRQEAHSGVQNDEDIDEEITAGAEAWQPEEPAPSWLGASIR